MSDYETAEQQPSGTEQPDPPKSTAELVKDRCQEITGAKEYWRKTFENMRRNARFARGKQWPALEAAEGATAPSEDERYVANITLRHINQRVANIYAKNPKVRAQRRQKLYAKVWDGTPEMLAMAQQTIMQEKVTMQAGPAAMPMPPTGMDPLTAQAVLAEAQEAQSQRRLYDRMGKTLEIVAQYSLDEPTPKFKPQAKQLVRRVLACSVGYVKLGYQRLMQYNGEHLDARIKDATDRMAEIEVQLAGLQDKTIAPESKEAADLAENIKVLQQQKEMVAREGLVFSFPKPWSIIIDPAVSQLKGFVGAEWIAEEYILTPKQVKKIFKKDVGKNYEAHKMSGGKGDKRYKDQKFCAVYYVYDLVALKCFALCMGYPDYLKEPGDPDVALEQFHPYFVLSFNDIEPDAEEDNVYPPSDVDLLRHMQLEYNRAREGLRIHRQAQRPAHVTNKGVLDDDTKAKFASHIDHEIIETNLSKQDKIADHLQPKPTLPITPELYETENVFVDTQRVVGDQPADLGGISGATATESQIASRSRASSIESNIDDLDEFLTDVMRSAGQILLLEMRKETVIEIAGPGAAWPDLPPTRKDIARELQLEVRAGSSGKPNRQARLTAIEKTAPFLIQTPGVKPRKLAEFMLGEIDEGIEMEDFLDDSLPSIAAMNAMAKPNLAPAPGNDAQGPAGAMNAPKPTETPGKTQNLGGSPPSGLTPG